MQILLTFFDDSSLFTALNFVKIIKNTEHFFFLVRLTDEEKIYPDLSERQIELLENYDFLNLSMKQFYSAEFLINFDIIYITRMPNGSFNPSKIINFDILNKSRPFFIQGWTGLEFTPEKGLYNRRFADGVCFSDGEIYKKQYANLQIYQKAFKFFPNFYKNQYENKKKELKKVYFFAQAIIPAKLHHRMELLQILIDTAYNNTDKEIIIKLRNLPNENKTHKHKELFPYQLLIEQYKDKYQIPQNLSFSTQSMEEVLVDADFCITCSSTAGFESLVHGIPTAFYLDYNKSEHIEEYSTEKVQDYLKALDVIYTAEEIINLAIKPVNRKIVENFFSTKENLKEIFKVVHDFKRNYAIENDWMVKYIKENTIKKKRIDKKPESKSQLKVIRKLFKDPVKFLVDSRFKVCKNLSLIFMKQNKKK